VPAAAVIPAPIAYIKVVAVKKLVVGRQARPRGRPSGWTGRLRLAAGIRRLVGRGTAFTVKKLECSRQARAWIRQHGIME
jgi:hypothetical protein